jgi:phage protein D
MRTPAYRLTLGNQVVDTTDEPRASTVISLKISLDLEISADSFTLEIGKVGSLNPERGDDAVLELGYAGDDLVQVMRGTVVSRRQGLESVEIRGHGNAEALLCSFADQSFLAKTAGEITRDLAGLADVTVARAEDGTEFPAYVIDGRRSLYHHMAELAELSGFDLYLDANGELVLEFFSGGQTAHVFEHGEHLLTLETLETPSSAGEVQAWGEGPGASRGDESWAWLSKDFGPRRGTAGSQGPILLLQRPALRTAVAAQTAALARHTTLERQRLRGSLLAPGRPEVKLGDSIRLRGLPDADLETFFQVRSVTHRLTKIGGFTTAVGFRSLAEGSV